MNVCKNKITDEIRDLFDANPLRVPEARILPLCMLHLEDWKPRYMGAFRFMVNGPFEYHIPVIKSELPSVSDLQSKKICTRMGFEILSNFLRAFNIDPAAVGSTINRAQTVSFSFSNVIRKHVDPLQFGQILSQNQNNCDPNNIFLKSVVNDARSKLALITDVITSTNFSIHAFSDNGNEIELDIRPLLGYVNKSGLDLTIVQITENTIEFTAPLPLTFAFSCVELKIDKQGIFRAGAWINNVRTVRPHSETEWNKIIFDRNSTAASTMLVEL